MSKKTVILLVTSLTLALLLVACDASDPHEMKADTSVKIEPTTYYAVLVCADCAAADIEINVWQKAGISRGSVNYKVPHNTTVKVLDSELADDGRRWYFVKHEGHIGWIAEDFVQK